MHCQYSHLNSINNEQEAQLLMRNHWS